MLRQAAGVLLISISLAALAQASLEVISLRYRTADQVLDTLRPLVEPGGTLTGQGNQLIVRVSPGNLAEIQRALDAIDRPQRRLQVLVRFDDSMESSRRELGASGTISNRGSQIELRGEASQGRAAERVDQRLQMLEGGRATIYAGQLHSVQDTISGFEVVPRVSGNMVTMRIHSSRAGSSTVSSTASGRLGEWFELGAIAGTAARDERGIGTMSQSSATQSRRVWVKVDPID
jgi:type II secretory pathway component GspD/PulD (secretin)